MARVVLALALAFALAPAARADEPPPGEDDPKLDRPRPELHFPDEDDPKLARGTIHKRVWPHHDVPRFKLAYRFLMAAGLEGGETTFHALEFDYYPSSFRFFRFGLDSELGFAGGPFNLFYFTVGPVVGFQWPGRVTPFVDARFVAGLAGAVIQGIGVVSYMYTGGLEAGIELYYASRFYLTAAIGWAHPVYSGADVEYVRAHPTLQPVRKEFADDSFTFKIGLGL
ncbi:MAG TPA: hypothetical protein VFF06_13650 [Polyangia bacterium]|nr:hypothetical protein [Polyangia bacterium]